MLGDAVTKISENDNWPKFVVKLPKPDTLLTPEQFTGFLVQDVANITTDETRTNGLFILAHSVSCQSLMGVFEKIRIETK